jgi:single-strand DNA-binding protein
VVHGRLCAHVWTNKAGLEVTTFEVEAFFVGHDLNRGTSAFQRRKLTAAVEPPEEGAVDAA